MGGQDETRKATARCVRRQPGGYLVQDGRELFYVAADRKVMSVAVKATSGPLEFGTPRAMFTLPFAQAIRGDIAPYTYDVMPDGQRFLALAPTGDTESPPMTVILNWQAELSTGKK
jgi:hypothetical protein